MFLYFEQCILKLPRSLQHPKRINGDPIKYKRTSLQKPGQLPPWKRRMGPQSLQKVVENWAYRLEFIRASRGGHLPEFISKTNSNAYLYNKTKFLSIKIII